ncbi:unnamed protein product, partial [Rotaria sp. Silwood1]
IDVRVPPQSIDSFVQFLRLDDVKIEYIVRMHDIGTLIEQQNLLYNLSRPSLNVNDFAYDKYHSVDEIHAWIDQMASTYPTLATPFTVGKSYENRDMKALKISSSKVATKLDGSKAEIKKAVWWDGGLL